MELTYVTILLTIVLTPTLSQRITPGNNAVKTILQNILSPRNPSQVDAIMTSAGNKMINLSNLPVTVKRRFAIADNLPKTIVRNDMPKKIIMQRPDAMVPRKNFIIQKSNNVILNGDQIVPKNVLIQRGDGVLTKQIIVNNNDGTKKNIIIKNNNDIPKRVIVKNGNDFSFRAVPQMRPKEVVNQKVFNQPKLVTTVPQQKVYAGSVNPFLPAASPISALVPTSKDLPPAIPQSKGRFLRKIPIPPPCL